MVDVEIQCDGCERVITVPDNWNDDPDAHCKECSSAFTQINPIIKDLEFDSMEELDEEEDWDYECGECGKNFETSDRSELVNFKRAEIFICKSCIDKLYPRPKQVIKKEVVKFIDRPKDKEEKNLLDISSKFD